MRYEAMIKRVRYLRRNRTSAEEFLWQFIRKKKLAGYRFLQQHPIVYETIGPELFFFVADFYCAKKKLIIELDGKIHEFQKEEDRHRDQILQDMGCKVLRFQNADLQNIDRVLSIIKQHLASDSDSASG